MRVQTGKGTIPWMTVLAIWSVSAVVSLPGLAISPILGDLNKVFPRATDLEIGYFIQIPSALPGRHEVIYPVFFLLSYRRHSVSVRIRSVYRIFDYTDTPTLLQEG